MNDPKVVREWCALAETLLEKRLACYVEELEAKLAEAAVAEHLLTRDRDERQAEVERLRSEFRRIEGEVASLLSGSPDYAAVLKVLHEAPRGGGESWVCGVCMTSNTGPRCTCGGVRGGGE